MSAPALQVDSLRKAYGKVVALDDVSLTVERGEVVGLLGPNGAGKTTLVSIVCGLRRADTGLVAVNGIDVGLHPQRARAHIGLAPQDLGIYPVDKVRHTLNLFGELGGLRGEELRRNVGSVAEALGLVDLMDRKAGQLSGGQKRRLHTAIALLGRPELVLLDEATTGADVEARAALLRLVDDLAASGSAVVYSTHYLGEIEQLDARVVILDRGKIIAQGSIAELSRLSGSAFVELRFNGQIPSLAGHDVVTEGSVARIRTTDPAIELGSIFTSLGDGASRLQGVEVVQSDLEAVFLQLTGRRYEKEGTDVLAS